MYVTAHRVVSPKDPGRTAIHAFIHLHDDEVYTDIDWNDPDVVRIAEVRPGRRLPQKVTVLAVGGNRVQSYLDIAAADAKNLTDIEAALDTVLGQLNDERLPVIARHNGVTVRLGMDFGLEPQRKNELLELKKQAMALLRSRG